MSLTNEKVLEIRKDFPIFSSNEKVVYLDNASTTQKPESVIKAVEEFYRNENANVHRGLYPLSLKATRKYEEAHKIVADFINAEQDEIVFTKNTTESINLLVYTIDSIVDLRKRNEIVITEMEHHSNFVPWQQLCKNLGLQLKVIKMKDDFTLDYEDAMEKITEKTAVVSVSYVSNVLGTVNDINLIVKIGKEKGAITVIDAAQSAGRMKLDVKKIGCDFLAFSGHKMIGPMGIGVLYGRKELLEKLRPFNFGGGMIKKVSLEHGTEWNDLPMKFEGGTQNVAAASGFMEAVNYLKKVGLENIFLWEKNLTEYCLEKLKNIEGVEIYHPKPSSGGGIGVISFNISGIHPHDIASLMGDSNIAIRGGHHCAMPLMNRLGINGTSRISFYIYNTFEDVDRFIETLKNIKNKFN